MITIGGATLGGSGKTPVAIAWTRREAEKSVHVALIGHAYRARPKSARVVSETDRVEEVGDEALLCARALGGIADVVVAPSRQGAIDFAVARGARVLVIDGVAQIAPRRADVAVLVSNSNDANACPPAGDLRAPLAALRALTDVVVRISEDDDFQNVESGEISARVIDSGARAANGEIVSFEVLSKMRVGLGLSIAHPERVLCRLARRGVVPVARACLGDHAGADLRRTMARIGLRDRAIDAWLITEKCASFVRPTSHDTPPIYVVGHELELRAAEWPHDP